MAGGECTLSGNYCAIRSTYAHRKNHWQQRTLAAGEDAFLEYDGRPFAIECKWRSHLPKDISKELLPPDRVALFENYATARRMPVYLLLGIGGLPSDPDLLLLAPLDKNLSLNALSKSFVRSENLLEHIVALFPQPEEKMAGTQTTSHPDTKRTTRN